MSSVRNKPSLSRRIFGVIFLINEKIEKYHPSIELIFGLIATLSLALSTKEIGEVLHILKNHSWIGIGEFIRKILPELCHLLTGVFGVIIVAFNVFRWLSDPLVKKVKKIKRNWVIVLEKVKEIIDGKTEEPIYFKSVSEQDINDLAELSLIAYGNENRDFNQRVVLFKEWHKGRNDFVSFVCNDENEKIGYISILPLANSRHYEGNVHTGKKKDAFSQFNIIASDIINNGPSDYILIQGVYIDKRYASNPDAVGRLLYELLVKLALFVKGPNSVIYSETFYKSGEFLANLIGLYNVHPQKRSHEGHKFSEMSFNHDCQLNTNDLPDDIRVNAEKTISLIDAIKNNVLIAHDVL